MRSLQILGIVLVLSGSAAGWQGSTAILPSQRLDPTIQEIVSKISQDRIVEILKKMESFGTRNTLSDPNQPNRGVGASRQWIFDQFKSYSPRLEVSFDTYTQPKGGRAFRDVEIRNVMAVLPGKTDPDRWIIIGGHYDSINNQIPADLRSDPAKSVEIDAPGVTDNGSGLSAAMECARVMSQYEFKATIVFVAFIGEEQGLYGSTHLAQRLREKNQTVEAVFNNDIIGSDVAGNGSESTERILVFSEDPNDSPSRQLARYIRLMGQRYYPELVADMVFRADRFGRGGDHTPFNTQGYAAVRFTSPNENFSNQHTPTDTFANTNPLYTAKVTRLNAAAIASMALAPRPPAATNPRGSSEELAQARAAARGAGAQAQAGAAAGTRGTGQPAQAGTAAGARGGGQQAQQGQQAQPGAAPQGRGQGARAGLARGAGYDAALSWEYPNPDPDLAGFIVVMRSTTAPDWEREIFVGNVRQFTLKNTPIDQLVFGVKAVDTNGHESPVSAFGAGRSASSN
jgi:hypothetical protein